MTNRSVGHTLAICLAFLATTLPAAAQHGAMSGNTQSSGDGGLNKPVSPPPGLQGSTNAAVDNQEETKPVHAPKVVGLDNAPKISGKCASDEWVAAQNKVLRSLIVTLAGEKAAAGEESHEANLSETQIMERRLGLVKQLTEASRPRP